MAPSAPNLHTSRPDDRVDRLDGATGPPEAGSTTSGEPTEAAPVAPPRRQSVGVIAGAVGLIVFAFLLVDLVIQNGHDVRLHFLWAQFDLSVSALVLVSAFVGVVLDEAVGIVWRRRRRRYLDLRDRQR
jgi:uncharacterized integral membrane protein